MKNLSWKASFKTKCDGTTSFLIKIKHKKTVCKVVVPDINVEGAEDAFGEQFDKTLETAFGKKKAKKISKQVFNELSEL